MKYYLDTEFHEYQRKPLFSKPFRTIELISIGIVAEDGREYYAVSKDFDLKAAWNSYQLEEASGDLRNIFPEGVRNYWLRKNVLKALGDDIFTFSRFKTFINHIGKSNTQIAKEIKKFTETEVIINPIRLENSIIRNPEFYAYYADYDWVVFCWLFGKMIDLPKGFPMYCRDLKQMLDGKIDRVLDSDGNNFKSVDLNNREDVLDWIEVNEKDYPQQSNEHNALADAKWNKELHKFIEKL